MTENEKDEHLNELDRLINEWVKQNKPPTLWEIMRNDLGFSVDISDKIVEAVSKWLPKEDPRPSYNTMQWDKCVKMMRNKLK